MSGSLLIENFDQFVSAPNGAGKIRELVLLLAFQGKLVEPDEPEGRAHDLLQEISVEKERLVAQRLLRPEAQLPDITPEEIPYPLPNNWRWTRLGDIVNYGGAEKVESREISDEDWVLDLGDIEKDTSRIVRRLRFKDRPSRSSKARFTAGDVLYGKLRPYLNKVIVADSEGYCTTEIIPIHIYTGIASEYLKFALMRPDYLKYVVAKSYGMKMPRLGTDDARGALIPLAPTREQFRIATKINEMMAHLDDFEAHRRKQTETRLTLNSSALTHLVEAKEPKTFAIHWKRIHDNFDLLYNTPETVGELRKAILQLAVQGKLVQQDPTDEPASTLLEKIKAEKEKLIAEKKIRKSEPLPPIKPTEIPYELPRGWEWVRLGDISSSRLGKMLDAAKNKGEFHPYLRNINVQWMRFYLDDVQEMRFEQAELDEYSLENGDILVCEGGEPGRCAIWNRERNGMMFQKAIHRVRVLGGCEPWFVLYCLLGDSMTNSLDKYFTGATIKHLTGQSLAKYVIPLPPKNQQAKIVDVIKRLLGRCDEIEHALKNSSFASEQLMEAVVREVVGPTHDRRDARR